MLREEIVFGPIKSRRLGSSLGINLLPTKGKLCNFDCIYCECGWNRDGREDTKIPTAKMVREALEEYLSSMMLKGESFDAITFSGDGEPTLNPDFPQIIDDTLTLRDIYFPEVKVCVLSNATRLSDPKIFDALCRVDEAMMKIDAPTNELAQKINMPYKGYDVQQVLENLKRFKGNFTLQTMMLDSGDFSSASVEVNRAWMDIVRELKPRKIAVYTIARPDPQEGLVKYTREKMESLVKPLVLEGFNVKIYD